MVWQGKCFLLLLASQPGHLDVVMDDAKQLAKLLTLPESVEAQELTRSVEVVKGDGDVVLVIRETTRGGGSAMIERSRISCRAMEAASVIPNDGAFGLLIHHRGDSAVQFDSSAVGELTSSWFGGLSAENAHAAEKLVIRIRQTLRP